MRPFLNYYGSAWARSVRYPVPRYNTIIEPFAGGAGYSTRYATHNVILCEINPRLAAIWRYLIAVSPGEILSLPDVPLDGAVEDVSWPCDEAKWLAGYWLDVSATRPYKRPSKWMRDQVRASQFWGDHMRSRIAQQVPLIRHWRVFECSYGHLPGDILGAEATWFIDPPYCVKGYNYEYGSRAIDYAALAGWCREREGQVIVCEQEGADWLPFSLLGVFRSTKGYSKEVVWLSDGAPETQQLRQGVIPGVW